MDVLHIFHTKCLIARTRRVSSVLTNRWRLYMITTMRCPALVLGTFWGSARRQRRDIFNYLLMHILLPKPDWFTQQSWKQNYGNPNFSRNRLKGQLIQEVELCLTCGQNTAKDLDQPVSIWSMLTLSLFCPSWTASFYQLKLISACELSCFTETQNFPFHQPWLF